MAKALEIVAANLRGRKLVWNILYYGGHVALFAWGWWKQAGDERLALLNTLRFRQVY